MNAKLLEMGPTSFSMMDFTTFHSSGSVESKHFWNSRTYSAGNKLGLDATNCPSLTYVAPNRSNSFRSATGAENSSAVRPGRWIGEKSWSVRDMAKYAWIVRDGAARGPAS